MAGRSNIEEQVYLCVDGIVAEMGLELVDVEYRKEPEGQVLRIIIDKPGGVSIDDCSDVSTAIDPILDEKEIIKNHYLLEVSSPGLDRPLKTDKDIRRAIGNLVEINTTLRAGAKSKYEGILRDLTEDSVVITLDEPFVKGVKPKTNGQEMTIRREEIKLIKKAIRF